MSNEISNDISLIFDKIISRITNFINNSNNNQLYILDKLKSIDNFINSIFPKDNLTLNNIIIRDKILKDSNNIFMDINEEKQIYEKDSFEPPLKEQIRDNCISSNQYTIIKLKRILKEQHEKYQIRELGYLERIYSLQKKLKSYENKEILDKSKEIKNNKKNNLDILNKHSYLLKSTINKKPISFYRTSNNQKRCNKLTIKNYNQKEKPIDISINENNKLNFTNNNNKVYFNTFSDLMHIQKTHKDFEISKNEFNSENSKIPLKNEDIKGKKLFINNYKLKSLNNSKVKIKNLNVFVRHNYNEIKKTIEDGRRKIRFLKDCRTPEIYNRYRTLFETEN